MLILTAKEGDEVYIDVPASTEPIRIVVMVSSIRGNSVRQGFEAPKKCAIHRSNAKKRPDDLPQS